MKHFWHGVPFPSAWPSMSGGKITGHTLVSGNMSARILSRGCVLQDWRLDRGGRTVPLVLGYEDPSSYLDDPFYLGAVVGRVANRISGASFVLDDEAIRLQANEQMNTLHGGTDGLARQDWTLEPDGHNKVRLSHRSPDGAAGFPGNVDFEVEISLSDDRLTYQISGQPDRETPVNLATHNYFTLGAINGISELTLQVSADHYTQRAPNGIPDGRLSPLPPDLAFQSGATIPADVDDNFALNDGAPAAVLSHAASGLALRVETDQPGLQVYGGSGLGPRARALPGQTLFAGAGVALEPQGFPDAPNRPEFPSILCSPDRPYRQSTSFRIVSE